MIKVFLINEEMREYLVIYEEAVSHINAPKFPNFLNNIQAAKKSGQFYFCLFQALKTANETEPCIEFIYYYNCSTVSDVQ